MPLPITDEEKIRLARHVFSLFAQYGFDGISMDEVARRTKISKATLYKYFKSKEDIVRAMVDEAIEHINSLQLSAGHGMGDVLKSLSSIYSKGIMIAAYSSSEFLSDLQNKFPDIYADYFMTLDSVQTRFAAFYESAVQKGYCRRLPLHLIGEQFKNMLPTIINGDYLRKHNTALSDAIAEYYRILLYQILNEEYLAIANQKSTYTFVDGVVETLTNIFLIR